MGRWDVFRTKPLSMFTNAKSPVAAAGGDTDGTVMTPVFSRQTSANGPASPPGEMEKTLSVLDLIGFEIGSIIGPGIFVTTGLAVKDHAGPGVALSFLLAGVLCTFAGFVYCELGARVPSAGGAYSYAYMSLGELPAFITASLMSLQYFGVASGGCRAAANYITFFFDKIVGIQLPWILRDIPLSATFNLNLLAPMQAFWLTRIIMRGTEMSTAFSNIVAAANVMMIIIFIITGFCYSDPANWIENPLPNGVPGILSGTSVVFYAFNGFDACATLTEEVPNPERVIPRGLLGAITIVTAAYIGIGFSLTGMVPYDELDDFAPFSAALAKHKVTWAFYMITFSAVLNCWASSFASIVAQPRLMFAIAKDGLLPPMFKNLDRQTKTPLKGTIFAGIVAALFAGCLDFANLSMTVSCGILFVYVFTGIIILRIRYLPTLRVGSSYRAGFHAAVVCYAVGCFVGSLAFHNGFYHIAKIFLALAMVSIVFFVCLWLDKSGGLTAGAQFVCPGVPLVPLVSIAANTFVALSLGVGPLFNVAAFLILSTLVYLAYGTTASKLNFPAKLRAPLLNKSDHLKKR